MRIGELATRAGVPPKTIRFWESAGLVSDPPRTPSGYRDYDTEATERLQFIRHAQAAGLSLGQIRQILEVGDSGDAPCEHVGQMVADRLGDIEARIAELAETRRHLQALTRRAAAQDPADCRGYCSIITG